MTVGAHEKRTAKQIDRHIANLGNSDREVSRRAEGTLMRYYGARALEPLIKACESGNAQVRYRAGWALAHTQDARAYETILRMTRDPDGAVRYDAAYGLGVLGDARAVEPLITLLQEPDEEYAVDSAAAMGLQCLGGAAVPALMEVAAGGTGYARIMAIGALGSIGDTRATELLTGLAQEQDPDLSVAANEALEEITEALALVSGDPKIAKTNL